MRTKAPTILDKAIQAIDEKIAALQLARAHLLEEQAAALAAVKPRKPRAGAPRSEIPA